MSKRWKWRLAGLFTAEYTLDLDHLFKTVIIETVDLAILVDEKIIIMEFEVVTGGGCSPIVPQWDPSCH